MCMRGGGGAASVCMRASVCVSFLCMCACVSARACVCVSVHSTFSSIRMTFFLLVFPEPL